MGNITIPVLPFIANVFEKADEDVKRKVEIYVNTWLNNFFSPLSANERLFKLIQKGSAEAYANGLTPGQLDELLKTEE